MTATSLPAGRRGRRHSRSREEIVNVAIRMLDRDGMQSMTFRAVARELDMTVGALGRYFKSLADLEDEVAATIMSKLRPLQAKSKSGLRKQLLRLSLDMLEINRAHPYMVKIHGPASATLSARMTRQCLKVLVDAGIDFDKAMAIFSLVGSLSHGWAATATTQGAPEQQAEVLRIYVAELGEFAPQMQKLFKDSGNNGVYSRWLSLYIDALLAD